MDNPDDIEFDDDEHEVIYIDSDGEELEEVLEDEFPMAEEDQEPPDDIAKFTYKGHTNGVFCCAVSKDQQLAITGGEDDMAYLWSLLNGETVFECTGHKDSVVEVGFSHDNKFVATADIGGMIQVWSVEEKKLIWCFQGDDLEFLFWHHMANALLFGSRSGVIYVWQIPEGNCKVMPSHGSAVQSAKVLPGGKEIISCYEDGQLKLWDIKSQSAIWQQQPQQTSILGLEINQEGTLVIIGPSAQLFKVQDGKHVATLLLQGEVDIEVALFNNELNVVVTGSLSGQLCVWDLGKLAVRHQAKIDCGITVMRFGTNGCLYVGATDGCIYVCDVRTGKLVQTLTGHLKEVLSISVFNDGKTVLSTSDDGTAKIFEVNC